MNLTLDPSTILTAMFNGVFLVLGILIKMELHDIKFRITRLENVFIVPNGKD